MDEDMRTVWCGNLCDKVTEELLYELFLQGGPVQRVSIPKDRDGKQRTYGFITYKHIDSVSYALRLFDGTMLFDRTLSMKTRNNIELQPIEDAQNPILDINKMLQLGQQMILGNSLSHLRMDVVGMNMLPDYGTYSQQPDIHSHKDDRRDRRAHPYYRSDNRDNRDNRESRDNNNRREHRSRNHKNYYADDYSRRDYRNNRRNYY